jgi:hypothetical protein
MSIASAIRDRRNATRFTDLSCLSGFKPMPFWMEAAFDGRAGDATELLVAHTIARRAL